MTVTVRTNLSISSGERDEPEVLITAQILGEDAAPIGTPYFKRFGASEIEQVVGFCLESGNLRLALAATRPIDQQAYGTQRTVDGDPPSHLHCGTCVHRIPWSQALTHWDVHVRDGKAGLCISVAHSRWSIATCDSVAGLGRIKRII